jgi:CRISPR-associated exonuclease Cas4
MLFLIPGLLILIALALLWIAARRRSAAGLPAGRVVYTDTGQGSKVEKPLFDPVSGLVGKPDYLIEQDGVLIPVEVKSSYAPGEPYDSHIYQLAAYCLLVFKVYGKRPPHGFLRYRNRTFSIDFTAELEARLLDRLAEMRLQEKAGAADRSHESPARCAACGYRENCDQRL